jgi:glyoxylase-like metal-dependent hydrolase (beta-lactamase superfamily II)
MLEWAQNRLKSFLVITTGGEITTLSLQLKSAGFSCDDITDVIYTHLHFDHCGGGSVWDKTKSFYRPLFKNAKYWSNKSHWGWAESPNPREKASFLSENLFPIESSGALSFVSEHDTGFKHKQELNLEIMYVNGHTEKQMIPKIQYQNKTIVFAADLIPTADIYLCPT